MTTPSAMSPTPQDWAQKISTTFCETVLKWIIENDKPSGELLEVPDEVGAPLVFLVQSIQEESCVRLLAELESPEVVERIGEKVRGAASDCNVTLEYDQQRYIAKAALQAVLAAIRGRV